MRSRYMDQMELTICAMGRCPHCCRAKRLHTSKAYAFKAVDVTQCWHEVTATTR
jgi:glutaredoxin